MGRGQRAGDCFLTDCFLTDCFLTPRPHLAPLLLRPPLPPQAAFLPHPHRPGQVCGDH